MANNLAASTVVEGVEWPEQLEHVLRVGFSHLQGYLIAKPLAAETYTLDWLNELESRLLGMTAQWRASQ
jgi:EAL domain-containing protein (putative c-di-GMP-specific phosphodiesterase class I)